MSGTKVVIIVLVLVAVLAAVAVAVGVFRDPEPPKKVNPDDFPAAGALGSVLVFKRPLKAEEVSCPCLEGRVFTPPPSGPCVATIGKSDVQSRTFSLRPNDGAEISFEWKPNKDTSSWRPTPAVKVRGTLKPGKSTAFQVPKDGGTLTLTSKTPGVQPPPRISLED